jgi:hypothetical protein
MSCYAYARFEEHGGQLFRFDTRVYLDENQHSLDEKAECVAAIVAKNSGSAKPADGVQPDTWAPVNLDADNMLTLVRKWFMDAYHQVYEPIPANAFVQVWNLFYLCDRKLSKACSAIREFPEPPACPSESTSKPKLVWFAWGGGNNRVASCLNAFKDRFLLRGYINSFYFGNASSFGWNPKSATLRSCAPTARDFAKHPQGLLASPIVDHLSFLIKRTSSENEEIERSKDLQGAEGGGSCQTRLRKRQGADHLQERLGCSYD